MTNKRIVGQGLGIVGMACLLVATLGTPASNANSIVGATGKTGCNSLNMHYSGDSNLSYRRSNLTSGNASAVNFVMNYRINPTDLSSYSTTSTSSSVDITIYDGSYTSYCNKDWWTAADGGVYGMARCNKLIYRACDGHRIYLNTRYTNSHSYTNRKKLLCHEVGHTLGISHNYHGSSSTNSCMKSDSEHGTTTYSSHEKNDMINYVW